MHYCIFVVLLLIAVSLKVEGNDAKRGEPPQAPNCIIGTGRGAITAVKSGGKWELREMPYTGDSDQWWHTYKSAFGGTVIALGSNKDLVWDTKGYQFVAGTPVVLYKKKTTQLTTKNQRWLIKDNKHAIIYDYSMVANVTQSGKVVLAKKTSSAYQQFTLMYSDKLIYPDLWNFHTGPVSVSRKNSAGEVHHGIVAPNERTYFMIFKGSVITVKDMNGTVLPPSPFTVQTSENVIRIPPLVLTVGVRTWSGEFTADKIYTNSFNISIASTAITGSGFNEYWGSYTVSGTCEPSGFLSMYFRYAKPTGVFIGSGDEFSGRLDAVGTTMFGNWTRSSTNKGTFQFTLQ